MSGEPAKPECRAKNSPAQKKAPALVLALDEMSSTSVRVEYAEAAAGQERHNIATAKTKVGVRGKR